MIIHDCSQGSAEWFALRLGRPSASKFGEIVTPAGKLSKASRGYALRLVAERLLHATAESSASTEWMDRGRELEASAVRQYEFAEEVETYKVGFVTTDDGRVGASPDRLIKSHSWGLEIKCPAQHTLLGYLLDGRAPKYRPQVQGQMMVAELDRSDFYAWHPRMPPLLVRTDRDDPYIAKLRDALDQFCDRLDEMEVSARKLGLFQEYEMPLTPAERERLDADERLPSWLQSLGREIA